PCGPLLVEAALASEPPGGLALELAAECRLLRGRRVARFPVARPAMADMPDLSHLTDEEREIIEGVIMRQRQEEQREHEIMRRKQDEVAVLEQTIRTRNEMQRAAGVELAATCQICLKTKFADGVGHSCHYCRVRCCARCGGKVTLRSNKVIWVCILCRKKQELLSKTGQWIHKSTGHDSMLWRMESDLRNLLPQVDATLDKRPKLERAHSAAEKENLPLQRSGSALRRQYSQQDPKCYGDLDALPRAHQIPSYSRQKTAYGIDDLPPPSQSNQLLPLPHSSAIHPPLPPRSSSSDDEVQDCVSDENDEYRDRGELEASLRNPHLRSASSIAVNNYYNLTNHAPTSYIPEGRGVLDTAPTVPASGRSFDSVTDTRWRTRDEGESSYLRPYTQDDAHRSDRAVYKSAYLWEDSTDTRRFTERRKKTVRFDGHDGAATFPRGGRDSSIVPHDWASLRWESERQTSQDSATKDSGIDTSSTFTSSEDSNRGECPKFPLNWQVSTDGTRMVGHMVLRKTVVEGSSHSSAAILGLKVVGGKILPDGTRGAVVEKVKKGSIADLEGQLRIGDEVLQWNGVPLQGRSADDVASVVANSKHDTHVELVVSRPLTSARLLAQPWRTHKEVYTEVMGVGEKPSVLVTSPGSPDVHGRRLVSASGLSPRVDGSPRCPYAKLFLLPDKSEKSKRRTKTLANTLEPRWNQTFVYCGIRITDIKKRTLEVTVWDLNRYGPNDFLGEVMLDLESMMTNHEPSWYKLRPHDEFTGFGRYREEEADGEHLSPPSTSTSRLSDSDTPSECDLRRHHSLSSLASSSSPPPPHEMDGTRCSRRDMSPSGRLRNAGLARDRNAQRAMRAQVSADLEERKWIGPHHIGATLTYRSTPQGWERHYAGLSDSELASRGGGWAPRRRLSPDAAAGDSDIESVGSVTSSAFSTQSERPRPTRMLSQPRNPFIIKSPSFDSIISLPHSNTNNIFQVNPNQLYNKPLVENKQNYTTLRENHHPHSMSKKIPFTSSRPSLPRSYIVVDPVSVFHDYGRSLSWPEYDELNYDNSISADTDQLLYNSKSSVKSNLQKYFTTKMQRFDSKYSKYTELYPNSKRFAGNDPDNLHPNPIHAPKTLLLKKLRGAFNFQFLDPDIDVILSRDDLNDQDNLDVTHFHGYGSDSSIAETTIHVNTDTLKNTPLNFSSLVESDYGYLKVDPVSLRRKQRESQDAIPFEMRDSKNQIDPFLKGDEVNVLKRRPFNNIYSLPTNKTVNKGRRGGYQNHRNMVSIEEVPTAKEYYSPYSPMSNLSFNDDIIFNNQCNVEECSSILTPPNHVEKQFKTEANVTVSSQKHGSPHRAPNPAASVPSENNPASEQSLNSSPSTKDANDKHSDDIANGANIKRKKSIENGPNCSNDYGGRENGRNNNQQPTLERRESRRGQFTRSLSNADAPDEKADGSLSDTALGATSENEPSGDDALLKAEPRDYFGPGMGKKSNSTSQLSATGRKRRLGFGKRGKNSFTVQRSEEVVPGEMRGGTGVSRASSASSENEDDRWSPGMRGSSSSDGGGLSDFIDGLGPGQLVGRQLLGAPTLGDVQLSMCYQKGFLEVEVIRGRGLQARQGSRTLPAPYVKVTVWGDYGRIEGKKVFMGVAQIMLDDLNLSNIVIGWYKLFGTTSLLYIRLKYRLNNSTETMNHYVYLNLIIKYILSPNQSRYIPRYLTLNVTMLCYLHRIKLKTEN
ncbi:unnamed protein product, partial [Leptidea sinapis]